MVAGSLSKRQAVFALRCFRVSTHTKWLLCWGAMGKGISAPLLWCLGLLCWGASGTPIPCTRPYCRGQQCHWLALARWWGALQAHRQWLQRPNMFGLQLGRPVCLFSCLVARVRPNVRARPASWCSLTFSSHRCFTQWWPAACPRGKRSSQGVAFTYLSVFHALEASSLSTRQVVFAW